MSDLLQAADAIRRLNKQAELLKVLADTLDRVGSLDAAEVHAQERLSATRAALSEAEGKVAAVEAAAQKVADDAGREAQKRVTEAQADAESVLRDAKDEADRIVAAAKQGRDAITDEAARAGRALADANAALATRNVELSEVTAKIAAAREAVAKLLG